jgi:hypothetical protein
MAEEKERRLGGGAYKKAVEGREEKALQKKALSLDRLTRAVQKVVASSKHSKRGPNEVMVVPLEDWNALVSALAFARAI